VLTLNGQYPFWSIWGHFTDLERMFFLILFGASLYCVLSVTATLVRLRAIRKVDSDHLVTRNLSMRMLSKRLANLKDLIGAIFYLFGVVLSCGLVDVAHIVGDTSVSMPWHTILDHFVTHWAFAGNVFSILLALHLLRWFASNSVWSCSQELQKQIEGADALKERPPQE
jgi:hypothetical protein